jgi:hypothetical protein
LILLFFASSVLSLGPAERVKVANKIWENECGATIEGLTHWNRGESFGSFGIGHFIWYPEGKKGIYEETFPGFLSFLEEKGEVIPPYLSKKGCLWSSREEFLEKKEGTEARSFRRFLYSTKELQLQFIEKRQEVVIKRMKAELLGEEKEAFTRAFEKMQRDPRGQFALIDYLNFKGSGLDKKESYNGKGWGLLQVLLNLDLAAPDVMEAFVFSAKQLLEERVKNSPQDRGESRWLLGWNNRVDGYLKSL